MAAYTAVLLSPQRLEPTKWKLRVEAGCIMRAAAKAGKEIARDKEAWSLFAAGRLKMRVKPSGPYSDGEWLAWTYQQYLEWFQRYKFEHGWSK